VLLIATPAAAAPTASFSFSPNPTVAGQPATFDATGSRPGGTTPIVLYRWDWDGNGTWDTNTASPTAQHTFATAGARAVRLRVRDATGIDTLRRLVTTVAPPAANALPVAQFSFSPTAPRAGQEVFFDSFSYDPDGTLQLQEWDFDGDGDFQDGDANETDASAAFTFGSPGAKQVSVRVTDNAGATAVATRTVSVSPPPANPLPVAQFSVSPAQPVVGQQVSLRSFSYDPGGGALASQRWDLDGDGDFDEGASGPTAFTVFGSAGTKVIRLQVRDADGGVQTATQVITVEARQARQASAGLSLMSPFPVIRLAGTVYSGGARVRILDVRAPRRSRITVRCAGGSCPVRAMSRRLTKRHVRFKRLERFLRAGTVLSVSVRKGGAIGKYSRWKIRGGKLPKRTDKCLWPGKRKPARCPRL
jgi:PKD repeat protein